MIYPKDFENQIICGDCIDVIKDIPSDSIDLCLTDPPYGTNDNKGKVIRRGKTDTNFAVIDWDREVPLEYLKDLYRVMKKDVWGVIFTDNMFISHLWEALEGVGLKPRNTFYWIKHNKAPTPRSNFKSCVETAIVFTKDRTNQKWNGGGNQSNYIQMPFVCGKEKVAHPTQKPVKLMEHFLRLMSNKNDIILDPFCGSGTTAVAAKNLGRRFIGIDISEEYCEMGRQRLRQEILF